MPSARQRLRSVTGTLQHQANPLVRGEAGAACAEGVKVRRADLEGREIDQLVGMVRVTSGGVTNLCGPPQATQQQAGILFQDRRRHAHLIVPERVHLGPALPIFQVDACFDGSIRTTSPVRSSRSLTSSRRSVGSNIDFGLHFGQILAPGFGMNVLGDEVLADVARQTVEGGIVGQRFDDDLLAEDLAGLAIEIG